MKLFPYQEEGVRWLMERPRAYLADEMGLGKTIQVVTAAERLGLKPMVICPANARHIWEEHGCETISYAKVHTIDSTMTWSQLVLDEAHYAKSIDARRCRHALILANRAPRVWFVSGTPMPNHPGELYPFLRAVWPDVLHEHGVLDEDEFREKFARFRMTMYGPSYYGTKNGHLLREILRPFMLRRKWQGVRLQLPPIRWEVTPLDVAVPDPDNMHEIGDAKALLAGEQIERELEDSAYQKIVVMAYHHSVLDTLHDTLRRFGVARFDGTMTDKQKSEARKNFQEYGNTRVFLGQIRAAGVALNLTAAHEIAIVEQLWSPEDNYQAVKRIHRISQEHPCRARTFTAVGTIDDDVARVCLRKLAMKDDIITPLERN